MPQAEIGETTYTPEGWRQEPLRLIVRRVRIPVEELSEDTRSRRRRTMPKAQLELALEGHVDHVYGYSFILTDLEGDAAEIGSGRSSCSRPRAAVLPSATITAVSSAGGSQPTGSASYLGAAVAAGAGAGAAAGFGAGAAANQTAGLAGFRLGPLEDLLLLREPAVALGVNLVDSSESDPLPIGQEHVPVQVVGPAPDDVAPAAR